MDLIESISKFRAQEIPAFHTSCTEQTSAKEPLEDKFIISGVSRHFLRMLWFQIPGLQNCEMILVAQFLIAIHLGQRKDKKLSSGWLLHRHFAMILIYVWLPVFYYLAKNVFNCTCSRLQKPSIEPNSLPPRNSIKQLIKACGKTDKAHKRETVKQYVIGYKIPFTTYGTVKR